HEGPLTRPSLRESRPLPQRERWRGGTILHGDAPPVQSARTYLSLGGEVAAQRRVRGPWRGADGALLRRLDVQRLVLVRSFRLPQLDRIAFRVGQPREAAIRIVLGIDLDADPGRFQLAHHRIELANPEVEHPLLLRPAEIVAVGREGGEYRRSLALLP